MKASKATRKESAKRLLPIDTPGDLGNADEFDPAPVIVINPKSSDDALLSTAMARAHRLAQALDAWTCASGGEISAADVTAVLYPGAFELSVLLEEMWHRRWAAVRRERQNVRTAAGA